MWQLPALGAGTNNVRLPISDWAARQLTTSALTTDCVERRELLRRTLLEEPLFLLWAVSSHTAWRDVPPDDLGLVVDALLPDLLDLLGKLTAAPAREKTLGWNHVGMMLAWRAMDELRSAKARDVAGLLRVLVGGLRQLMAKVDPEFDVNWIPAWLRDVELADVSRFAELARDPTDGHAARIMLRWQDAEDESDLLPLVWQTLRESDARNTEFARQLSDAKLASLKQLAYGASHEINNPLANIATRAQSLLADETDPERRRKLATIAAQAFRAHEMISDLMLFARPPQLRRESCNLCQLAADVVAQFAEDARQQQVELTCLAPSEPVLYQADPVQLGVAIHALVRNSLEALDGPGKVQLTIEAPGQGTAGDAPSCLTVRVSDSGPGVTGLAREHLFDPFFSGREAGRGLGFGLAKCWRIVTEHGGRIDVSDAEGGGAVFSIRLPLV